ncbi:MAG TPA: CotH kinase family protein, partial [Bacteroidia bacterium]|nr:CotH kinase family protein [Bacteroidia bacterium]
IVPQQEAYIQAYVDSFETALAGPAFTDTLTGYAKFIDVNSFVDFFLLNEFSRNVDGYRLSTYLYKDKNSNGGKLTIGPAWDFDLAWHNADYCNGSFTSGWTYNFGNVCAYDNWQNPFWWDRLLEDPRFRDRVKCRWENLKTTIFSVTYIHNYCDSMYSYLDTAAIRNFTAWPVLGAYVWPNPSPIPTTFIGEINELKTFINARWIWLNTNMPGTFNGCNIIGITDGPDIPAIAPPYPNPFSDVIQLSIYLFETMNVEMELFNALGQAVQPVQKERHGGGTQVVTFTPDNSLPPGIYLLRIKAGNKVWTQQLSKW